MSEESEDERERETQEEEKGDGLLRFQRLGERGELTLGVVERGPENDTRESERLDKKQREKKVR